MPTLAHVRYVTGRNEGPDTSAAELLGAVLGDPAGLIGVLTLLAMLLLIGVILPWHAKWGPFRVVLDDALHGYRVYLALILRLATGIALLGAGVEGYWFVPHEPFSSRVIGLVLMACGFGLLIGFAVTLLSFVAALFWLFALVTRSLDVLMAFDVLAMLVLLAVVSSGRPSVDDLLVKALPAAPGGLFDRARLQAALGPDTQPMLARAFDTWMPLAARLGLGVALLYAGVVEKFLDPGPAIATAERYGLDLGGLDAAFWVVVVATTEVLLGLGVLLGIGTRPFAAVAFFAFTSTLFALTDDPVVAHVPAWGIATVVFILGPGRWTVPALWAQASSRRAARVGSPQAQTECANCGTPAEREDRYCSSCGAPLARAVPVGPNEGEKGEEKGEEEAGS